jgi:uncharacterized membrane protein YoaK (UPF0700 family)
MDKMQILTHAANSLASGNDDLHGPLPALLLALTMVTGMIDAVSYLALGNVFVANMTGNVALLGFAVADAQHLAISKHLVAIAAFLAGALAAGRLASNVAHHRGRFLAIATYIQIAVVFGALVVATVVPAADDSVGRYALIVLLAVAMGMQTAAARRLGVPCLTTTVLTTTLAGLAADSTLAGGKNPNAVRPLLAMASMALGAAIGAFLLIHVGVSAILALVLALFGLVAISARRLSSSSEAWTAGVA